ncbi:MAG TPA: helix-turn-helix domain-containing protein, partial [Pseudonocardia sp.]|uniref:alpha/beta hydrolase n=1 Tax=Pseudonocardia sp. TaxID=60912 RepID=UPI002CA4B930
MNRVFNATGQTVHEVVRVRRLARARDEVAAGGTPIATIATRWGFADSSHFSRAFKAHYGSSPRDYREAVGAGRGAPVHRAVARVQATVGRPVRLGSHRSGAEPRRVRGTPGAGHGDQEEARMARQDIEFNAEGVTLRGWFYRAEGASGRAPTVVLAHGFSAVKEMYLDSFAEVFAAAGLNALVFDNRNFGASDGEPRQEIDPWAQVRDYRHAITYAGTRPDVDPSRIGVWGSSYSGGHVLVVAAIDRRVKA